jgi:hypothetical protein
MVCIPKFIQLRRWKDLADFTYRMSAFDMWSTLQEDVAIIAVSVPSLKVAVEAFLRQHGVLSQVSQDRTHVRLSEINMTYTAKRTSSQAPQSNSSIKDSIKPSSTPTPIGLALPLVPLQVPTEIVARHKDTLNLETSSTRGQEDRRTRTESPTVYHGEVGSWESRYGYLHERSLSTDYEANGEEDFTYDENMDVDELDDARRVGEYMINWSWRSGDNGSDVC